MTTSTYAERRSATSWPMYAALGAGLALVLSAIATFWDVTGNDPSGENQNLLREYLVVAAIILVATAVVFGLVVRGATSASAGTRGLVLAIMGLLTLVVFWSGLPPVLATGALACGLTARPNGAVSGMGKTTIGIAAVTLVLAVVAAIAG